MKVAVRAKVGRRRFDFSFTLSNDKRTTGDVERKLAAALLERGVDLNQVDDWQITRIQGGKLDE